MAYVEAPEQRWAAALLFAAEPTDRALAGWAPGPGPVDGHPREWARKELAWLARLDSDR